MALWDFVEHVLDKVFYEFLLVGKGLSCFRLHGPFAAMLRIFCWSVGVSGLGVESRV